MKKFVVGFLLSVMSATASAGIIGIDTSKWLHLAGPSNGLTTGVWVGLNGQAPEKRGNSSGALVSDFELFGDFLFSGYFSPTTVNYDDNDIIGLVFGWQDAQNHYRLGWSQTQRPGTDDDRAIADITGKSGLFLIREVGGTSQTLFNFADLYWEDDVRYSFNVGRVADQLNIDFGGNVFSVNDSTFTSGHIGVYTESQTGRFWNLNAGGTPNLQVPRPVSEPGAFMFASGLAMLVVASRRKRKQSAK